MHVQECCRSWQGDIFQKRPGEWFMRAFSLVVELCLYGVFAKQAFVDLADAFPEQSFPKTVQALVLLEIILIALHLGSTAFAYLLQKDFTGGPSGAKGKGTDDRVEYTEVSTDDTDTSASHTQLDAAFTRRNTRAEPPVWKPNVLRTLRWALSSTLAAVIVYQLLANPSPAGLPCVIIAGVLGGLAFVAALVAACGGKGCADYALPAVSIFVFFQATILLVFYTTNINRELRWVHGVSWQPVWLYWTVVCSVLILWAVGGCLLADRSNESAEANGRAKANGRAFFCQLCFTNFDVNCLCADKNGKVHSESLAHYSLLSLAAFIGNMLVVGMLCTAL